MRLEHEHSQEDVLRSVAQPCEEQGRSTQVLLTPVPKARAASGAGQGQAETLRVVVVEAALVEEPPGLHTTEGHRAARGVLLPVLDALHHCLLDHLQRTGKLTCEPLWDGQKQPLLLLAAAAPSFSSAPSLTKGINEFEYK